MVYTYLELQIHGQNQPNGFHFPSQESFVIELAWPMET